MIWVVCCQSKWKMSWKSWNQNDRLYFFALNLLHIATFLISQRNPFDHIHFDDHTKKQQVTKMTSYPASQRWICVWPLQSLFLLSEGGWLLDGCDSAEVGWLTDDWPVSGTATPPTCLAITSTTAYRSLHNTASVCSCASGLWLTIVHNGTLGGHKHQRTDLCTILQSLI